MADKLDVTSEPTGPEDEGVYAPDPKPIEADQEGGAAKPAGDPAAEVMGAKQPFADLDKVDVTEKPKPFDLEGKGTTEPEPQPEPEPEPQTPPGFGPDPTFFREPEPAPSAQDDEFKDFDAVRRDPSTAVRDLVQGMSDEETLKEFDAVRPKQPAPTATPAKPAATEAPKPDLKAIAAKTGKAIDEVRREALKVERDSIDKEMQGLRDMETERVGMTMPGLLPFSLSWSGPRSGLSDDDRLFIWNKFTELSAKREALDAEIAKIDAKEPGILDKVWPGPTPSKGAIENIKALEGVEKTEQSRSDQWLITQWGKRFWDAAVAAEQSKMIAQRYFESREAIKGLNEQIAETQGRLDAMRGDMPRRADGDIASPYSDFSPMAASVLRAREASIDDLDRNLAMLRSQLRKANAEYRVQADTMLGLREGETKTMARNAVEASSRAVVDGLFTSTAKVLGVGEGYLFGPMWEAMTGQRYETARDSYLYALGEEIEEQAKKLFPGDAARQKDYTTALANGTGSMIAFMISGNLGARLFKVPEALTLELQAAGIAKDTARMAAVEEQIAATMRRRMTQFIMVTGGMQQGQQGFDEATRAMFGIDKQLFEEKGQIYRASERDRAIAFGLNFLIGTSEALPISHMLEREATARRAGLFRGMAQKGKEALYLGVPEAIEESFQEGFQQITGNWVQMHTYQPSQGWDEDVLRNATIGGLLGYTLGSMHAAKQKNEPKSDIEDRASAWKTDFARAVAFNQLAPETITKLRSLIETNHKEMLTEFDGIVASAKTLSEQARDGQLTSSLDRHMARAMGADPLVPVEQAERTLGAQRVQEAKVRVRSGGPTGAPVLTDAPVVTLPDPRREPTLSTGKPGETEPAAPVKGDPAVTQWARETYGPEADVVTGEDGRHSITITDPVGGRIEMFPEGPVTTEQLKALGFGRVEVPPSDLVSPDAGNIAAAGRRPKPAPEGQTSMFGEASTADKIRAEAIRKRQQGTQENADFGLFGSDRDQLDLVDKAREIASALQSGETQQAAPQTAPQAQAQQEPAATPITAETLTTLGQSVLQASSMEDVAAAVKAAGLSLPEGFGLTEDVFKLSPEELGAKILADVRIADRRAQMQAEEGPALPKLAEPKPAGQQSTQGQQQAKLITPTKGRHQWNRKGPVSLADYLIDLGGIKDRAGELSAIMGRTVRARPGLISQKGLDLDDARRAAIDAGYLTDASEAAGGQATVSISDLLDALSNDINGQRVYKQSDMAAVDEARQMAGYEAKQDKQLQELDAALEAAGIEYVFVDGEKEEVANLVADGVDVVDALEQVAIRRDASVEEITDARERSRAQSRRSPSAIKDQAGYTAGGSDASGSAGAEQGQPGSVSRPDSRGAEKAGGSVVSTADRVKFVRGRFLDLIEGKSPLRNAAKELGLTEKEFRDVVAHAASIGWIKMGADGQMLRTPVTKRQPRPDKPAPKKAEAPAGIDRALEIRLNGVTSDLARGYVLDLAGAEGEALGKVIGRLQADRKVTKAVLDEIKSAYTGQTSKARTKADAIRAIEQHAAAIGSGRATGPTLETADASGGGERVEPNWRDGPPRDGVGAADVSPAAGGDAEGVGQRGSQNRRRGRGDGAEVSATGTDAGGGVSDGGTAAVGERGDRQVQAGTSGDGAGAADGAERGGRGGSGLGGVRPGLDPEAEARRAAGAGTALEQAKAAQALADKSVPFVSNDPDNIRASLPALKPAQREDVVKVEARLSKPDKFGMLLTNGTGTGKTFSGLGVIKRFEKQGKSNILILTPSQGIADAWISAGEVMGTKITRLPDTGSAGEGIVITTYANLRQNPALADRVWDLIVPDEAHTLSQRSDGSATDALHAFRGLTNRNPGLKAAAKLSPMGDLIDELEKVAKSTGRTQELEAARKQYAAEFERLRQEYAKQPRAKALFLSATPFAYHKSTDYAEGFLFDYPPQGHGYNNPGGQAEFLARNFGYRIRYNRAEQPGPEVDTGIMERAFYQRLRKEGALSGRRLEVEADYDRRFVSVDDAVGAKIDEALDWLVHPDNRKFAPLRDMFYERFDHLAKRRLLEAMKAVHAIPRIKKDIALGRKVVVFHDYLEGGGLNPFAPPADPKAKVSAGWGKPEVTIGSLYDEFVRLNPYVKRLDFSKFRSPIETLKAAFPDILIYNGTVSNGNRKKARDAFNKDGSGKDLILVQGAAGEAGISLHDTTGVHQRVLYDLSLPTRPTSAIQREGRIYREGQKSDAIIRYLSTGTGWERRAFAETIAERASTAENLALGDEARTLKQSFIDAFLAAGEVPQGKSEGKGGKAADRARNGSNPFEAAKTFYFAEQKARGRRDQREGKDYYATPEPLGFKMVEWSGIRSGEKILEPSAGHGAIARFFPELASRTVIEPTGTLLARASLAAPGAKLLNETFEDHYKGNKYDAIVMNPPFGQGGKTAIEHVAKAAEHLREGGRIVALIPRGSADARLEAFRRSKEAQNIHLIADISLPSVTFERAGTAVSTHVIVLEKHSAKDYVAPQPIRQDLTGADTIAQLFDELENLSIPGRDLGEAAAETEPASGYAETVASQEEPRRAPNAPPRAESPPRPVVTEARTEPLPSPALRDEAGLSAVQPAPVPAPGKGPTFDLGETTHGKTGAPLFVATINSGYVSKSEFGRLSTVAKSVGGYYSSFRGGKAIPGFQFPSAAARQAFIDKAAPKPTYALSEEAAKQRVQEQILRGETVHVDPEVVSATMAAMAEEAAHLPGRVMFGAISALRQEGGMVTAVVQRVDGSRVLVRGLPVNDVSRIGAFFDPRTETLVAARYGGLVGVALGGELLPALRGELWHEFGHKLESLLVAGDDLGVAEPLVARQRLIDHADALGVLDLTTADYLTATRKSDGNVAQGETQRELYERAYAGYPNGKQAIESEKIAHLFELYRHGVYTHEDMEPVRDILKAVAPGLIQQAAAGNGPGMYSGDSAGRFEKAMAAHESLDHALKDEMAMKVSFGESADVDPGHVERVMGVIQAFDGVVPPGASLGQMVRVEPMTELSLDGRDAVAVVRLVDGSEKRVPVHFGVLKRSVAVFEPVTRSIILTQVTSDALNSSQLQRFLRGVVAHEVMHAHREEMLRPSVGGRVGSEALPGVGIDAGQDLMSRSIEEGPGAELAGDRGGQGLPLFGEGRNALGRQLTADDWLRLSLHASHVGILDVPLARFLDVVGFANRGKVTGPTIKEIYTSRAQGMSAQELSDLLDEESVSMLAQLAATRGVDDDAFAPVKDILEKLLPGVMPGTQSVRSQAIGSMLGQVSASGGLGVPLKAMASGDLDPSPEARKARAEAMGFDTSKVWYHGTEKGGFSAFDPNSVGSNSGKRSAGFFFTESRTNAETYSGSKRDATIITDEDFNPRDEGERGVYSVYIRPGKQQVIDWGGGNWDEGPFGYSIDRAAEKAQAAGYDSLLVNNVTDEGRHGRGYYWGNETLVVFDPANIRSVNAEFDPAKSGLPNLLYAFTAYHGSPHDFDRFDSAHIGKGEGAQAFGRGLYFAENEGVAKQYRNQLGNLWVNGQQYDLLPELLESGAGRMARAEKIEPAVAYEVLRLHNKTPEQMIEMANALPFGDSTKPSIMAAAEWKRTANIRSDGRLYQVRINAEPEQFLDWDKPMDQQSDRVREVMGMTRDPVRVTGQQRYKEWARDFSDGHGVLTSQILREAGIPGIRYLDQGSRADGKGTYNYVVFNDDLIEIEAKDGVPVSPQEKEAAVSDMKETQSNLLYAFTQDTSGKRPTLSLSSDAARAVAQKRAEGDRQRSDARATTEPFVVSPRVASMLGMKQGAKILFDLPHIMGKRGAKDGHDLFPQDPKEARAFIQDVLENGQYAIRYHGDSWSIVREMPDGMVRLVGLDTRSNVVGAHRIHTAFIVDDVVKKIARAVKTFGADDAVRVARDREAAIATLNRMAEAKRQARDHAFDKIITSVKRAQYEITRAELQAKQPLYAFGGEVGANSLASINKPAVRNALAQAKRLLDKGRQSDTVFEATGWFKGPDGEFRFEIDDSAAKLQNLTAHLKPVGEKSWLQTLTFQKEIPTPKWATGKVRMGSNIRLVDVLNHAGLYEAYPFLQQMRVTMVVGPGVPEHIDGGAIKYRVENGRTIYSPIVVRAANEKNALDTLLHEIQHYIQKREGFASGSATSERKVQPAGRRVGGKAAVGPKAYYSPDTIANQVRKGEEHRLSALTMGERAATLLADAYDMLDETTDARERAEIQRHIDEGTSALQAILRVGAHDYVTSYGEQEAESVVARRAMTAEQRRQKLNMPKIEGQVSKLTTPRFKDAADAVRERAQRTKEMRDRWAAPIELAPGVTASRVDEDQIDFRFEVDGKPKSLLVAKLNQDLASGFIEITDGTAFMSLGDEVRKVMVDAAETHIRSMNYLPVIDTGMMTDDEFAFFHARDPNVNPFDLRPHRARLEALMKEEFPGEKVSLTFRQQNTEPVVEREGRNPYEQKPYYGENTAALIDGQQYIPSTYALVDLVRSHAGSLSELTKALQDYQVDPANQGPYGHMADARHMEQMIAAGRLELLPIEERIRHLEQRIPEENRRAADFRRVAWQASAVPNSPVVDTYSRFAKEVDARVWTMEDALAKLRAQVSPDQQTLPNWTPAAPLPEAMPLDLRIAKLDEASWQGSKSQQQANEAAEAAKTPEGIAREAFRTRAQGYLSLNADYLEKLTGKRMTVDMIEQTLAAGKGQDYWSLVKAASGVVAAWEQYQEVVAGAPLTSNWLMDTGPKAAINSDIALRFTGGQWIGRDGSGLVMTIPGDHTRDEALRYFEHERALRTQSSQPLFAFMQDTQTGREMRHDLDALGFYSKALEAAKGLKQAKGTPEQMLAMLKAAGVKEGEIEATKLADAFAGQKSVTKADIIKHLEANRVKVKEASYKSTINTDARELRRRLAEATDPTERNALASQIIDAERNFGIANEGSRGAKWQSYSLDPSNPTYRETVLHLPPSQKLMALNEEFAQIANAQGDLSTAARLAGRDAIGDPEYISLGRRRSELVDKIRAAEADEFRNGHFPEANVIAHMRTSMQRDAQGRPVFHLDELQSDWGQRLRDGGVRDEAKIAEMSQRYAAAQAEHQPAIEAWNAFVDSLGQTARMNGRILPKIKADTIGGDLRGAQNWYDSNSFLLDNRRSAFIKAFQDADRARSALQLPEAELRTAEAATPGHPLVNTTDQWVNTAMRRAIRQAVEADADFIAIPSGDTVLSYGMGGKADGIHYAYDTMYPKNLRNILQRMDKSVQGEKVDHIYSPVDGSVPERSKGHTLFPLTEAVKAQVKQQGLPLFAFGRGGVDRTSEPPFTRQEADDGPPKLSSDELGTLRPGQNRGAFVDGRRIAGSTTVAQRPAAAPQTGAGGAFAQGGGQVPPGQGGRSTASPGAQSIENVKPLTELVADLNQALGLTTRYGRLDPVAKRLVAAMGGRLEAQYNRVSGVARLRRYNDITNLAHEGGHRLEEMPHLRSDFDGFKAENAYALTNEPAKDTPAPQLDPNRYAFSGLELKSDIQDLLVKQIRARQDWTRAATEAGAAKSQPRLGFGKVEVPDYSHLVREDSEARDDLVLRLGKSTTDALLADIREGLEETGADLEEYVSNRFSETGTPEAAQIETPSAVALSEGFAELFATWVVNPDLALARYGQRATRRIREILDGGDPEMLGKILDVQSGYKEYLRQNQAELIVSRTVTQSEPHLNWMRRVAQVTSEMTVDYGRAVAEKWSDAETIRGKLAAPFTVPLKMEQAWYAFQKGYLDRHNPLKVAVRNLLEIGEENGIKVKGSEKLAVLASNDAYKLARLMDHSRVWATNWLSRGVKLEGSPQSAGPSMHQVLNQIFGSNKRADWKDEETFQRFGAYLVARRLGAEFDRHASGQRAEVPDMTMSAGDVAKAISTFENDNPQFVKAAELFYGYTQNLLRVKFEQGFISEDVFNDLSDRYDYAPLNRVMTDHVERDDSVSAPSRAGANDKRNKRRMMNRQVNSLRDFVNPVESVIQDTYATAQRAATNNVIRALTQLAEAVGPGGGAVAERIPAHEARALRVEIRDVLRAAIKQNGVEEAEGEALLETADLLFDQSKTATIFQTVEAREKGERIVYLWEGGKRVPIRLGDDRIGQEIFDLFSAIGQDNYDTAMKVLTLGATGLRAGVTKAPEYIVVNWFRDQIATWILSKHFTPFVTGLKGAAMISPGGTAGFVAGAAAGAAAGGPALAIPGALVGAYIGNKVKSSTAASREAMERYQNFAGMMGGIDTHLVESMSKGSDWRTLRDISATAASSRVGKVMRLSEMSEYASRLGHFEAVYQSALKSGLTPDQAGVEAAYVAHDVLDFSRRGEGFSMRHGARLVPFLNAKFQGLSVALRTASGERDDAGAVREVLSPYVKGVAGQVLTAKEKEALPNSIRMWIKMAAIGLIGLALHAHYKDDWEKEEFNDYMNATHWFVKIGGRWFRIPKPFELAVIANAMEAGWDGYWKGDPRARERFQESIKTTIGFPISNAMYWLLYAKSKIKGDRNKAGENLTKALNPEIDVPLVKMFYEMMTNYDTFANKAIVPDQYMKLAPELQFNQYVSELAIRMGKMTDLSPAMIDHLITGLFGSLGRDVLSASNSLNPNRPSSSPEDLFFVSRFMRRASRGSLSVGEFWKEMGQQGGEMKRAEATYKEYLSRNQVFDANRFLNTLKPDDKAHAVLATFFKPEDLMISPLHRAEAIMNKISGIRKEMILDTFTSAESKFSRKNDARGTEPQKITMDADTKRRVNEVLEDLQMIEARNALIAIGHEGWAQKKIIDPKPKIDLLRSISPETADELAARITKKPMFGAAPGPFDDTRRAYNEARPLLLKDGKEADVHALRPVGRTEYDP